MVSFFDKGPTKALRNSARRHSKTRKMETNGPRDLKLGWSMLLMIEDVTKNYFFQNWGLKGFHF